jgi:hypothetical protein
VLQLVNKGKWQLQLSHKKMMMKVGVELEIFLTEILKIEKPDNSYLKYS